MVTTTPATTGRGATSTTSTTSRCSPRSTQGYRNLIKVSSHAYLDGFFTSPASTSSCSSSTTRASSRTTGCLGGAVSQALLAGRLRRRARARRRASSRSSGATRSSSSCRTTACPSSCRSTRSCIRLARDLRAPLLATNDSHYTHRDDAEAHDALLCVQTGAHARRPEALQVRRRRVLPEDRGGDARPLPRLRGGVRQHAARSPSAPTSRSSSATPCCRRSRRRRATTRTPTCASSRIEGAKERYGDLARAPRCSSASSSSSASSRRWASRRTSSSSWDLVRYARVARHPRRSRAGERGRLVRRVLPAHRRHRPDPLRPAVRAVPQPGPQADARHRHGLRLPLPRRDDQVRGRALRRGPRRADHHVLHDQGAGRGARRRARARLPVRRSATRSPSSCRR